jgi:hypothetical protein
VTEAGKLVGQKHFGDQLVIVDLQGRPHVTDERYCVRRGRVLLGRISNVGSLGLKPVVDGLFYGGANVFAPVFRLLPKDFDGREDPFECSLPCQPPSVRLMTADPRAMRCGGSRGGRRREGRRTVG